MGEPLPISRLVALIGDENIQVQNVAHNMSGARKMKDHYLVTFATAPEHGLELMNSAALGTPSKLIGLVLWFPANKLPPADYTEG